MINVKVKTISTLSTCIANLNSIKLETVNTWTKTGKKTYNFYKPKWIESDLISDVSFIFKKKNISRLRLKRHICMSHLCFISIWPSFSNSSNYTRIFSWYRQSERCIQFSHFFYSWIVNISCLFIWIHTGFGLLMLIAD